MSGALASLRSVLTDDERARYADLFAHGDVLEATRPPDAPGRYRHDATVGALATLAMHQVLRDRRIAEIAAAVNEIARTVRAAEATLKEWR